eukprot:SAG11_NODE_6322_length_1337_cov_1.073506_2_plen_334_part_00
MIPISTVIEPAPVEVLKPVANEPEWTEWARAFVAQIVLELQLHESRYLLSLSTSLAVFRAASIEITVSMCSCARHHDCGKGVAWSRALRSHVQMAISLPSSAQAGFTAHRTEARRQYSCVCEQRTGRIIVASRGFQDQKGTAGNVAHQVSRRCQVSPRNRCNAVRLTTLGSWCSSAHSSTPRARCAVGLLLSSHGTAVAQTAVARAVEFVYVGSPRLHCRDTSTGLHLSTKRALSCCASVGCHHAHSSHVPRRPGVSNLSSSGRAAQPPLLTAAVLRPPSSSQATTRPRWCPHPASLGCPSARSLTRSRPWPGLQLQLPRRPMSRCWSYSWWR